MDQIDAHKNKISIAQVSNSSGIFFRRIEETGSGLGDGMVDAEPV